VPPIVLEASTRFGEFSPFTLKIWQSWSNRLRQTPDPQEEVVIEEGTAHYSPFINPTTDLYLSEMLPTKTAAPSPQQVHSRYSSEQLSFAAESVGPLILPLKNKFEEYAGGVDLPLRTISSLIGTVDSSHSCR
jgi:hypothetical protein